MITDPSSLIKELLDNALDARATSINIDITTDTLSSITVRDNGHGVAPSDRDLLCKRYCTSKIRDYGDLKDIGGTSLGFRGEALASACEIAGDMSVTTRVEGEEVASCLKMTPHGEIKSKSKASHPVGTTIKITDLFKALPVRKQTALKASAKTLAKIKAMLQAYALARPYIRLALRVLKAKNDKGNWTYVPAKEQKKEDAAFKVVGKECAGQCEWQVMELHGFEVQALMPRPNALASKISGFGHFLSIDDRPVGTARGTLKQIITMFKERLRACSKSLEGVKDPFIWMNITCPVGSYDPNVEPAKDDVVFEDSGLLLEAVGALFSSCYPPRAKEEEQETITSGTLFELVEEDQEPPRKRPRTAESVKHTMYAGDDDEVVMLENSWQPQPSIEDEDEENSQSGLQDASVSNPWVMAKMNASTKPRRTGSARNGQLMTPLHERNDPEENSTSVSQAVTIPTHPPWTMLTPAPSSPPKRPPHGQRSSSPLPFHRLPKRPIGDDEETGQGFPEQEPSAVAHQAHQADEGLFVDDEVAVNAHRWRGWSKTADFTSAANLPPGTPAAPPHNAFSAMLPTPNSSVPLFGRNQGKRQQKPRRQTREEVDEYDTFTPQAEDDSRVWFDSLQQAAAGSSPAASGRKRNAKQAARQDIDIRDMFASARPTQASSGHADLDMRDEAAPYPRPPSRKRTFGTSAGAKTGINAPFRPVVPMWHRQAPQKEDVAVASVNALNPQLHHGQAADDIEDSEDDGMLELDSPARLRTSAHTPPTSDHIHDLDANIDSFLPPPATLDAVPSSIAALSTPRRLAACVDCHDPSSHSHPHTHTHSHAQAPSHLPSLPLAHASATNPPTRTKSSASASNLGRTSSRALSRLPLERIPAGAETQNLVSKLHTSITSVARLTSNICRMEDEMPLQYGTPVWGVLEAVRAGDVSLELDSSPNPGFEDEGREGDGDGHREGEGEGGGGSLDVGGKSTNTSYAIATALTAPPPTQHEMDAWQAWVGTWISRTYQMPDAEGGGYSGSDGSGEGGTEGDADDGDEEQKAGLYVVDALVALQRASTSG